MLYFVAAAGIGVNVTAKVYGPYSSVADFHAHNALNARGETFALVGNKAGYPNRLLAQSEANKFNNSSNENKVTETGGNTFGSVEKKGASAVSAVLSPFTGIAAIGAFFNKLSEANTWLRVGEGFLGLMLIIVALDKMTGASDKISSIASKVPIIPV